MRKREEAIYILNSAEERNRNEEERSEEEESREE